MLTRLAWLALEVKYLDPARSFYAGTLALPVLEEHAHEATFAAGETALVLRRPTAVPRGGLHTHFACSIPAAEYDAWWDRLSAEGYELEEVRFGETRSLYCYDPDGNCVELGESTVDGPGIDGVFEVALEVESLERAEAYYRALGFEPVDRGETRRRVRLGGPVALELWEPQLGIADARGGVHVDLGFETDDLERVEAALEGRSRSLERRQGELIARDGDGHHLTVRLGDSSE
ncbi:VOC family protein [Natronobiforma cellulositropha]|uniref:VOC family protein n=1 Tax=Natronobiforma cellulositropha TaxID=1679076 RepID=UPI0021D5FF77|nr:VOC family protein [Natronobiforma cellulositropha]